MSFTILYRASVKREMRRLDAVMVKRIDAAILALAENPRPSGCVRLSGQSHLWRIRVGDYRVLYEIQDQQLVVLVVSVAHRREAYRGL
ncbi:MAG: type II toxin-antitoxin system RelE/ParE family toxin [Tepidisphaeraceae bacterium]|jgi:mRNA interferase RelE/StbE